VARQGRNARPFGGIDDRFRVREFAFGISGVSGSRLKGRVNACCVRYIWKKRNGAETAVVAAASEEPSERSRVYTFARAFPKFEKTVRSLSPSLGERDLLLLRDEARQGEAWRGERMCMARNSRGLRRWLLTLPNLALATNSSLARTLYVSRCLFSSLTTRRVCTPQGEGFVKLVNPSVAARQRTPQ